jgi:hypothetical protein
MKTARVEDSLNDSWFQHDERLRRARRSWRLRRIASEHPPASEPLQPADEGTEELDDSWFH